MVTLGGVKTRILQGLLFATCLLPSVAHAASWGSFDPSRMAYAAGALGGSAHDDLRAAIEAAGDTVAAPTAGLDEAYLGGVDVFYTGMLSGGTGATAGDLGTLSPSEAEALEAWIAGGGTLVITVDSTGLPGDAFADVYASWGAVFGMTDVAFVTDEGTSTPLGAHPVLTGVGSYAWVNHTTFSIGDDAQVLGEASTMSEFIAVLEPASGFAAGGRVLVVGDHNMFTNAFIDSADNAVLAANIVDWAGGECGNGILESDEACDDGNIDDGDGCSAACALDDEGGSSSSSSGGGEGDSSSSGEGDVSTSTSSGSSAAGSSSGEEPSDTSSTGGVTPTGSTGGEVPEPGEDTDTDAGASGGSSSGCSQGRRPSAWAFGLFCLGLLRRGRGRRRSRS